MKAVKLTKIIWNLNGVDPEDKEDIKKSLPTTKGFIADDDFEVSSKVPYLLKNKYGYDIINFSFSEIHIIENMKDLLLMFAPKGEKPKKIFSKGNLSDYGQSLYDALLDAIHKRVELEKAGTDDDEMPKILDKVMLSLEKITGLEWSKTSIEEYKAEIDDYIKERMEEYLKSDEAKKKFRKEAKKSLKAEIKEMDDEDDDDAEQILDGDDDDDDDEEE